MSSSRKKQTISSKNNGNVFVTVGTTQFDKLVTAVTSKIALEWMVSCGYKKLKIQYGTGQSPSIDAGGLPISIEAYDFLPSLEKDMQEADLIVSHAGAGTVMEALRLQKKLIVVINTLLMNNHQSELAVAMSKRGHLLMVEKPEDLDDGKVWASFEDFSQVIHEGGDENDFPRLLDLHLGFQGTKAD